MMSNDWNSYTPVDPVLFHAAHQEQLRTIIGGTMAVYSPG